MADASCTPMIDAAPGPLEVPVLLPFRSDDTRLMQLSVSSLALFWRCPERWRLRYLERRREPQTGAMVIGRAVGASIAAYFAARMAGEPLSIRTPTTCSPPSSTRAPGAAGPTSARTSYEVVANKAGGVALEPPVTKTAADLRAERGARPLTPEEFEELFGELPSDGEG